MSLPSFIEYLKLEKNYSKHTLGAYEKDIIQLSEFCEQNFEVQSIDEIDYSLIRSWIVSLVDKGIANRSINRKISSLRAYYKFLQKIGKIKKSPLAKHRALKTEKKVEIPFSEMEMENVLSEIPFENDFEGCRDKLIIELLYTAGLRRAELVNLKVKRYRCGDRYDEGAGQEEQGTDTSVAAVLIGFAEGV